MEEFELEPGEKVIKSVRQHWFLLAIRFIPFILLALLPLLIPPMYGLLVSGAGTGGIDVATLAINFNNPLLRFGLGIWWLLIWMAAFTMLTKFFLTQWVITSARIVDITQESLFDRHVSSCLLARVQDATTNVEGFFATVIGYGNLTVETAGSVEKFSMQGIAHPEAIRDIIMREITGLQNHDSLGTKVAKTVGDALL